MIIRTAGRLRASRLLPRASPGAAAATTVRQSTVQKGTLLHVWQTSRRRLAHSTSVHNQRRGDSCRMLPSVCRCCKIILCTISLTLALPGRSYTCLDANTFGFGRAQTCVSLISSGSAFMGGSCLGRSFSPTTLTYPYSDMSDTSSTVVSSATVYAALSQLVYQATDLTTSTPTLTSISFTPTGGADSGNGGNSSNAVTLGTSLGIGVPALAVAMYAAYLTCEQLRRKKPKRNTEPDSRKSKGIARASTT